jgi:hypothetical protein
MKVHRAGRGPHQANLASAINQRDAALRQQPSHFGRHGEKTRRNRVAGRAENAEGLDHK